MVNNASHNCLGEIFVNQLWVCDLVLVLIAFIVYFNLFVQLNWTKGVHGEVSKFVLIISKVSPFCFGYNGLGNMPRLLSFSFSKSRIAMDTIWWLWECAFLKSSSFLSKFQDWHLIIWRLNKTCLVMKIIIPTTWCKSSYAW